MRPVLALAVIAAGCPSFVGDAFACGPDGDCPAPLECSAAGICCELTKGCGAEGPRFHVDAASGARAPDGSRALPFKTLTAALAVAPVGSTIYLVPGRYGAGEPLPVVISGVTVDGEGAIFKDVERIVRLEAPIFLLGHDTARTVVRGLGIESYASSVKVRCQLGTSVGAGAELPEPNTVLEGVTFDARGVALEVEDTCNFELTGATLDDSSVEVRGVCARGLSPALRVARSTLRAEIGPLIRVDDCARRLEVEDVALDARRPYEDGINVYSELGSEVHVERARFISSSLFVHGRARLTLVENTFTGSAAITLLPSVVEPALGSTVVRARGNVLFGAGGVNVAATGPDELHDWGRPGDPGNNVFRCNEGDWRVFDRDRHGARIALFGNVWDHAPPTVSRERADGLDVQVDSASVTLDLGGAIRGEAACPNGSTRGP